MKYISLLRTRPMAIETATANEQHYEVGTGVLAACLGPRMKYSSCLYPQGGETLAQAEIAMLESYVVKAQLQDGMSILDLGYVLRTNFNKRKGEWLTQEDAVGDLELCTLPKCCQTRRSRPSQTQRRRSCILMLKRKRRASKT